MIKLTNISEDLRKWFGKGPTGGWDRYNTKGEKVGKCGDSEEGSKYAACLSNEKAAKLGKDGRAAFVKRKRAAQKDAGDAEKGGEKKKGQKPTFVKTGASEGISESSKEDIIKDLDKAKNDLLKKVDVLIAKKKKLYSDVDIESPMSADEKKLDKDIADLFSDINKLVLQKRSLKESELKGYLAADVVDDIVKVIGSKMVKGYIENAPNRNYIYLKLTDIKFGNDVVKMLKSKFGINAKVDKTFGNIPTVSFPSNKVISEAQAVSGGKVHKFITGKNLGFRGKKYSQIDFETLGVDNNNGTIRLRIIAPKEIFGNEMSLDFRTVRRGPFFKTDTSNQLGEEWSQKYKDSINCSNPKGFSQKAHCAGKKKNEDMNLEEKLNLFLEKNCPTDPAKWSASKSLAKKKFDVYPSAYANGWAAKNYKSKGGGWKKCNEGEANALCEETYPSTLDEACWDGYKQVGMKKKGDRQVPNCVPESVNEGLYHIGYNKGRGMGRGVFKDTYSSYKDAKKAVEKLEKERGGSYNMIAYYVADKDGNFVRESVNEARNLKSIEKEYFSISNDIQSHLSDYKKYKGTDKEKGIVSKLKDLNTKKKKLEAEMDSAVKNLYKDAELKIED